MRLVLAVACALIDRDRRVLVQQRPPDKAMGGYWEFPGGKLEAGETPEGALVRELKEELAIDVTASCLAPFVFASHGYEGYHALVPLYVCRKWQGQPLAREGQALKWLRPSSLAAIPMLPSNGPLIAHLRDLL